MLTGIQLNQPRFGSLLIQTPVTPVVQLGVFPILDGKDDIFVKLGDTAVKAGSDTRISGITQPNHRERDSEKFHALAPGIVSHFISSGNLPAEIPPQVGEAL